MERYPARQSTSPDWPLVLPDGSGRLRQQWSSAAGDLSLFAYGFRIPANRRRPSAALTFTLIASFEAINGPRPPEQPTAYAQLEPAAEWTEASTRRGSFRDPLDVEYLYLQFSANPGVFEIDRIELVQ